jgi:glycosyltransferase involved in cell wall biosynthesis
VRQAARRAAVLLASSATARLDFERLFRRPAEMLPETGIFVVDRPPLTRFRNGGALHLLWVENGAGPDTLPLLLEAVANLGHDVEYHLHVVGSAEREPGWKQMATELGVRRRVSFLGEMGAPGLAAQLEWAHLLVSTSLRGTSCVPILEALSRGVPVMCFDLHAAGDVVTEACGIRIPVTHPGHAIAAMASTVRALAEDKTPLLRLSAGACDRARSYLWRTNSARVLAIYRGLVLASPRASRRSGT